MNDTCLDNRSIPHRGDRVRQALQPVTHHNAHIGDTSMLELGEDGEPELRTLTTVTGP
jgi:hypothetical protein